MNEKGQWKGYEKKKKNMLLYLLLVFLFEYPPFKSYSLDFYFFWYWGVRTGPSRISRRHLLADGLATHLSGPLWNTYASLHYCNNVFYYTLLSWPFSMLSYTPNIITSLDGRNAPSSIHPRQDKRHFFCFNFSNVMKKYTN